MKFDQFDNTDYKDILLYRLKHNDHGGYPFYTCLLSLDSTEHYMHRHEFIQIYYVVKGQMKHLINGHEYRMTKGDMFVIPPYVPHSVAKCEHVRCDAVELGFKPEFINQSFSISDDVQSFMDFMYIEPFMVSESNVRPRINLVGKADTDAENIMNDLILEFNEKKPGFELVIKSLLLRLLALVAREVAYENKAAGKETHVDNHRESVQRVMKYMEEHYDQKICLEDAVKISLLCYSTFCTAFKSVTNKSFTRYLNELRVSKAKEYLKRTDIKIIEISSRTGFDNVVHFNRTFKQLTSLTPGEYKQANR